MPKQQCMVDLETLGTRPGDCILSLGAVLFNSSGITSEMYMTIDQQSSKAIGMKAQKSTIEWWQKQSPEAQEAAFKGEFSIESALTMFSMWLPKDTCVWGNGANFDNTLLAAAYRLAKKEVPWKFWDDRCYRTVKSLFPQVKLDRTGTHHNALDDAKSQALHLVAIDNECNLGMFK